jgi:hypothetical protein
MSGWGSEPPIPPVVEDGGFVMAGLGRRFTAWIVDAIVASFLIIVPLSFAIAARAVTVNSDVIDKLANDPHSIIAEPLLTIDVTTVWLAVAAWMVLRAAYFAGCWALFGGTLGQRLLSLDVVAIEDAQRLPVWRAIVRWVALEGVGQIAEAIALALVIQVLASVPFSQTSYGAGIAQAGIGGNSQDRAANAMSFLASWGAALWSIALIISVAINSMKRGIHDRLARSIVLARPPRGWQQYERWGRTEIPPTYDYPSAPYPSRNEPTGHTPTGYPPTGSPGVGYPQVQAPQAPVWPSALQPPHAQQPQTQAAPPADIEWPPIPPREGPTE